MKYIMKKNFMRKEFIFLLAFASIVNITESQASQLRCPTPKSIQVTKADKIYMYQGTSTGAYKVPFEGTFSSDQKNSKDFKLSMIDKTENNQLACYYAYSETAPNLIEIKTSDTTANEKCKRDKDDDMFFTCEAKKK